jgi:hypothetical protein
MTVRVRSVPPTQFWILDFGLQRGCELPGDPSIQNRKASTFNNKGEPTLCLHSRVAVFARREFSAFPSSLKVSSAQSVINFQKS